jgi:hypothetical protein
MTVSLDTVAKAGGLDRTTFFFPSSPRYFSNNNNLRLL